MSNNVLWQIMNQVLRTFRSMELWQQVKVQQNLESELIFPYLILII